MIGILKNGKYSNLKGKKDFSVDVSANNLNIKEKRGS